MIRVLLPAIAQILLWIMYLTTTDLTIRLLIFTVQLLFLWYQLIVE